MGKQSNGKLIAYLPLVLGVTCAVVVGPMLLVFWLREADVVTSVWAGSAIGVAMSLLASQAGGAIWKAKTDSDLLFSELMLWGWVQRWRSERRLTAAADLLGLTAGRPKAISGASLSNGEKTSLLTQLTTSLEARDQYTHGHSRRVARHAANIAKHMGLSRQDVAKIRAAGAMHDVGKVETPIPVLHKEGKLSDEEYAIVKRHPVDGAVMVATLDDEELTAIVRHHHERLDGTGYPDGLAGDAIPVGARILAVADTFDAITSTRPYRHAHAHKKALDILAAEAGTQLDPDAVRAFSSCYSGRRPLAYWTMLANVRPRITSVLGGGLSPANAANAVATVATAAAVGAVAVNPLSAPSPASPRLVASAGPIPSSSATRAPSRGPLPSMTVLASFDNARGVALRDPIPADASSGPAGKSGDAGQNQASRPVDSQGRDTSMRSADIPAPVEGQSNVDAGGTDPGTGTDDLSGHGRRDGRGPGRGHEKGRGKADGQGKANGQRDAKDQGGAKGQWTAKPKGGNGNGEAKGQGNGTGNQQSPGNSGTQGKGKAEVDDLVKGIKHEVVGEK